MLKNAKTVLTTIMAAIIAAASLNAAADSQLDKNHPFRDKANNPLLNQDKRINKAVGAGGMSHQQAHRLHRQDTRIRQEERTTANQDSGRINQREQSSLNKQENRISQKIGQ